MSVSLLHPRHLLIIQLTIILLQLCLLRLRHLCLNLCSRWSTTHRSGPTVTFSSIRPPSSGNQMHDKQSFIPVVIILQYILQHRRIRQELSGKNDFLFRAFLQKFQFNFHPQKLLNFRSKTIKKLA